ncbi:MAG: protein kinase [Planctomycetia bacterium]|nr:protein kinase [Planctomycetia bacterium]
MKPTTACPPADLLRLAAETSLAGAELETILVHLERCGICTEAFRTLSGKDAWSETLRNVPALSPASLEEAEAVARLIDVLRRVGPGEDQSLRRALSAESTTVAKASSVTTRSSDYSFLSPPTSTDELGRLGSYRVLRELGRGGMGIVFEAEDPALHRRVALKVMQPSQAADAAAKQRFLVEARATAAIEHEHIVIIHQVGEEAGLPYLTMQLLRGESLAARLEKGAALPVGEALRVALETAQGLAAAHARGLIHRDIKPANIWIDAKGDRVKVVDFGLARDLTSDVQLTQSGALAGTPAYMSPEQVEARPLDARTDLFSLGCVLYRMLTGRNPFTGQTLVSVLNAVTGTTPPAVESLNPRVPRAAVQLVERLLAKNRNERPASADEVVVELQKILTTQMAEASDVVPLPETATAGRSSNNNRRHVWIAAAAAAFFFICCGAWVVIRDKDGRETARVQLPEGGSATIAGESATAPKSVVPSKIPVVAASGSLKWPPESRNSKAYFDAQRAFAEWAISVGAYIAIDHSGYDAKSSEQLPKTPFRVQHVSLSGSALIKVTESDLARLEDVPELLFLRLSDIPLTSAGQERIVRLDNLQTLELANCGAVDDVFVDRVGSMTNLKTLGFEDCGPIDEAMTERIGRLEKLTKLTLDSCGLIDEALKPLAGLREMEYLSFQDNKQLTDEAFEHLQAMRKLKWLNISDSQRIRGRKVSFLQGCAALERLTLGYNVDDEGLSEIAKLKTLSVVEAAGPYTDKGLESLGALSHLKGFAINSRNVTDSGLNKLIRKCRLTETVHIGNTPGTDAIIDALAEQKALKRIDLPSRISASAYERLRTALPGTDLAWLGKPVPATKAP